MPEVLSPGAGGRLQQIQSVMEAGLTRLPAEQLVVELLERVREALAADTVTILEVEAGSSYLVATVSRGLEEEVEQAARVPVGAGFAGRVAAERRSVMLERVTSTNVVNPALIAAGIRSVLGVPLLAENSMLGVLHVGTRKERAFSKDDADLLQMVADRIALVLRTEQARDDSKAARALQRSLMPGRLPQVVGLELAARYVPGADEAVGGDWYDVFTLESGRFCAVMGDVAGHGLPAAVVMGRLRSALRAYALEYDDPAEVLERLDAKARHFEAGAMATVLYAVFEPDLSEVRISLAGHLPPVLAAAGEPAVSLTDVPVDPPVGVHARRRRRATKLAMPSDAVLCLFTDGLVERRGEDIDRGLGQLVRTVHVERADALCATIMATMVGHEVAQDDIALLVLRRHGAAS
ncbi:PP2C family protein-serine/threonine phosphatase [Fodinicola acaciae]|uniref:PP2C family protein-serine/threonine phosphatase n=1 Tax=Fodinicola acaciae TaxID=2681555 RepID=UPI001C9E6B7E|nr:GAF domain-containing SpoIIE family protein phosphatase [Fodinicola acaciae]